MQCLPAHDTEADLFQLIIAAVVECCGSRLFSDWLDPVIWSRNVFASCHCISL